MTTDESVLFSNTLKLKSSLDELLSEKQPEEIEFFAEKVYIHHWPPETPKWSDFRKDKVETDINTTKKKKQITIKDKSVKINNYRFEPVKKIGLTIPQFKRQSTIFLRVTA